MDKVFLIIVLSFLAHLSLSAQVSTNVAGKDFQTANGSVSFSLGQVFYEHYGDNEISISEGVQQAYKISTTTGLDFEFINLEVKAYPNPTTDYLNLKIHGDFQNFGYSVKDLNGRLVAHGKIKTENTLINMQNLSAGVYLISALEENQIIKTFKIVKK